MKKAIRMGLIISGIFFVMFGTACKFQALYYRNMNRCIRTDCIIAQEEYMEALLPEKGKLALVNRGMDVYDIDSFRFWTVAENDEKIWYQNRLSYTREDGRVWILEYDGVIRKG